jgi:hypothetical protein
MARIQITWQPAGYGQFYNNRVLTPLQPLYARVASFGGGGGGGGGGRGGGGGGGRGAVAVAESRVAVAVAVAAAPYLRPKA